MRTFSPGAAEMADIFDEWNRGDLESFLIEITARSFALKIGRPASLWLIWFSTRPDRRTGKWTSQVALDLGVVIPTSIRHRYANAFIAEGGTPRAGKQISGPAPKTSTVDKKAMIDAFTMRSTLRRFVPTRKV